MKKSTKKTPAKKPATRTAAPKAAKSLLETPLVRVEYPEEGEVVRHTEYTVRVGTVPEAVHVDVSIDDGEWLACRESLGLWWYDWSGISVGEHKVAARIHKDGGEIVVSAPRRFIAQFDAVAA